MAYWKLTECRFFCPNCGKETFPVQRKCGKTKSKFHQKLLYCPWCKLTLNQIEIHNDDEKQLFTEHFLAGDYKEMVKESIDYVNSVNLSKYV